MITQIGQLFGSSQTAQAYLCFVVVGLAIVGVGVLRDYIKSKSALKRDRKVRGI